ncbi:MAG: hypothetical protein AUG51_23290 [Acidobacteria bacterium 13_1_20CM_3_53_8]|nr:MAG: hypothetical protein AUG51_23290 [Acidobacteria bacterium 13_1_20CM_3_53_8]
MRRVGKISWPIVLALTALQILQAAKIVSAQTDAASQNVSAQTQNAGATDQQSERTPGLSSFIDMTGGVTADDLVAYALAHNGELLAMREEVEAARALVKQAGFRANPMLEASGARAVNTSDNSLMISGRLPLELGGRREARTLVAEREVEVRERMLADRERTLSAEVRAKFGEALAQVLKLGFTEELLETSRRGYKLVVARVVEGRTPPLEQNMVLVEVNRLRSMRETGVGRVEVAMLELRNLAGMTPDEPLRLRGSFDNLIEQTPTLAEATERALAERPDLQATRATERLAEARIAEARAMGRADASLTAGYQRMSSSFPVNGINERGQLAPVADTFHFLTFGVSVDLPVRNKNQGMIEAAVDEVEAAKRRREYAELTVRREVASAYAKYERAARSMEIFRVGVQEQAGANLNVVRQTYELGSKTLLDYIAEQRRFIEVENEYIDAVLDTYLARVEIERATSAPELIRR